MLVMMGGFSAETHVTQDVLMESTLATNNVSLVPPLVLSVVQTLNVLNVLQVTSS